MVLRTFVSETVYPVAAGRFAIVSEVMSLLQI